MNIYYILAKLPQVIGVTVLLCVIFRVIWAFYRHVRYVEDGFSIKNIHEFFDPYKQGVFYYKYNFTIVICLIAFIIFLCYLYVPPEMIEDGKYVKNSLLHNILVYTPNYLIHEFSHRFWGGFGWDWWTTASGNGMETLVPCLIYLFSLQIRGGNLLSPILFYWIATTLYDAGIYASDAVASKLALTSSDMVTNFEPGMVKGDWHYILQPLGWLDYAEEIGFALEILACIALTFAVYSIINYIMKLASDPRMENNNI